MSQNFAKRIWQCLLLLIFSLPILTAHDPKTHALITRAAVSYLSKVKPEHEMCLTFLQALLEVGSVREDEDPGERFMFHFFPALDGTTNIPVYATCSSPSWGLSTILPPPVCEHNLFKCWLGSESLGCRIPDLGADTIALSNQHRWREAIEGAKAGRWQEGLLHLGYVLHLLQDLTSPAHVRMDPHPPFDADPLEADVRKPDLPNARLGLVRLQSPLSYFQQLSGHVRTHFYSKDTVDGTGPRMLECRTDPDYYCDENGFKVAFKRITGDTVDARVAEEQWTELGPLAVRYTASLIDHFLTEVGPFRCDCFEVKGRFDYASEWNGPNLLNVQVGQPFAGRIKLNMAGVETKSITGTMPPSTLQSYRFAPNGPSGLQMTVAGRNFSSVPGEVQRFPDGALTIVWTTAANRVPDVSVTPADGLGWVLGDAMRETSASPVPANQRLSFMIVSLVVGWQGAYFDNAEFTEFSKGPAPPPIMDEIDKGQFDPYVTKVGFLMGGPIPTPNNIGFQTGKIDSLSSCPAN